LQTTSNTFVKGGGEIFLGVEVPLVTGQVTTLHSWHLWKRAAGESSIQHQSFHNDVATIVACKASHSYFIW